MKRSPLNRSSRPILRKSEIKAWSTKRARDAQKLLWELCDRAIACELGYSISSDLFCRVYDHVAALKSRPKRRRRSLNISGRVTVKDLDQIVNKIVDKRDGGKCVRCLSTSKLQHAHILGKAAHPAMRHESLNVMLLCESCHLWASDAWHSTDPGPAQAWYRDHFGHEFDNYLRTLAKARKGKRTDRMALKLKLEQELKDLECAPASG